VGKGGGWFKDMDPTRNGKSPHEKETLPGRGNNNTLEIGWQDDRKKERFGIRKEILSDGEKREHFEGRRDKSLSWGVNQDPSERGGKKKRYLHSP